MVFLQLRTGGDGDEGDATIFAGLVEEALNVLANGGGAFIDERIFGFLGGIRHIVLSEGGERAYVI